MASERRGSFRFDLLPGAGRVWLPGGRAIARLRDLGAGGGVLQAAGSFSGTGSDCCAEFALGDLPPFFGIIQPVRLLDPGAGWSLAFRFGRLGPEALRSLARFLIERHLDASRRIVWPGIVPEGSLGRFERRPVLEGLIHHTLWLGRPLWLHADPGLPALQVRARDLVVLAARQLLVVESVEGELPPNPGREYQAMFSGPSALYSFSTTVYRVSGQSAWLTVPESVRVAGFRGSLRACPPLDAPMRVAFGHPREPGHTVHKQALEVGARGLSFLLDPERDLLFPGEPLRGLTAWLPDGPVRAEACLRSVRSLGPGLLAGGIELAGFESPADAERWQCFVLQLTHPGVELLHRAEVGQAWRALQASGYVDLLDGEREEDLERQFRQAWTRHAESPAVSRFFLVRRDQRPVATAAASLVYPRTWMPHLFGIDRQERANRANLFERARQVNSGMMHLLGHLTDSDHFVFYFDSEKPFHDLVFGRFLAGYPRKDEFLYDSFRLYRLRLRGAWRAEPPAAGIEVVEADSILSGSLALHLQRQLAPIEVDAYAYREDEIALEEFSRRCAALDYERQRRIFFALERGDPRAALLVETGSEGLSVFGLLDRCWCFGLAPGGEVAWPWLAALLRRAAAHYAACGRRTFLYQDSQPTDRSGSLGELGFSLVANGRRWLGCRRIIPAFSNHVREIMELGIESIAQAAR